MNGTVFSRQTERSWTASLATGIPVAAVAGIAEYAMTGGTSGLVPLVSGLLGAVVGPWIASSPRLLRSWISFGNRSAKERWLVNSRDVSEREQWKKSPILIVGIQYSPRFFKDFFDVIQARSANGLTTVALVVDPSSTAARYLEPTTEPGKIENCVQEIRQLLEEADNGRGYVLLKKHRRVMRYSFIRAKDHIWVKFYTNESYRSLVPAVRIDRNSELFRFFEIDAKRLEEVSVG